MRTDIIRWDPLREVSALRAEMDRFLGRMGEPRLPGRWSPTADVVETDEAFIITAELPGVRDEDIHITLHDHRLRIAGERTLEDVATEQGRHRLERSYGSFERTFRLPPEVDMDKITAGVAYGVLKITAPKAAVPEPKRIAITPAG